MGGQCRSQERVTEIFFTFKRAGFSSGSARARVLPLRDSRAQAQPCGAWVQMPRGMWDLPGPWLEPVSPALAGRFFTTEPPGKPLPFFTSMEAIVCIGCVPQDMFMCRCLWMWLALYTVSGHKAWSRTVRWVMPCCEAAVMSAALELTQGEIYTIFPNVHVYFST